MKTYIVSKAIIFAIFFPFTVNVSAQIPAQECAQIIENDTRLACYDMLFKPEKSVNQASVNWTVETNTNPLDDSNTVLLYTVSSEGQSRWRRPITLILRCRSNKTELFINWQDYLGRDTTHVTTRIGSGDAETKSWGLSTDNEATFYPNNDVRFIKELLGNDRLVAQTTPFNESPITAIFNISGLNEAITPLRDECEW